MALWNDRRICAPTVEYPAPGFEALGSADRSTVRWAACEAARLLSPLGNRWAHVQGVVRAAQEVTTALSDLDAKMLIVTACLHDIGWAPELMDTTFHPIDGARWLRRLGHDRVADLVAHHSGARFEAALRGLAVEISEFENEESSVADALTYCDLTTGPEGEPVTVEKRWFEIRERYGQDHLSVAALELARPTLLRAVQRTEHRLQA